MENRFLYKFNEIIVVNIKTKNIELLLKKIYKLDIVIYNLEKINYKEINIEINKNDLEKIKKLSILNKISIVDYKGKLRLKKKIMFNKTLLLSFFIGLFILIFLSNVIFKVEVIHSSNELKKYIYGEIEKYGIKKYTLKKGYKKLNRIKEELINNNKNKIEWLEIESIGTKYIIRFEERKIKENIINNSYNDIVSAHDAVIKRVTAKSGVIVKNVNDYVRKGETIISGSVYLNNELKGITSADGSVYGEVWYNVSIDYPIMNVIKNETGNKVNNYSINFFNKKIIFGHHYKNSNIVEKELIKNNILPISINHNIEYETKVINGIYSEGEELLNARSYAYKKIEEKLKEDEYIISDRLLNYRVNSNTIYMNIFYKVYLNITDVKEIIVEE